MFHTISYISTISSKTYDIVGLHTISYVWHTMSYVLSCGLFRRRKHPGAPPLVRVNMGAAFPVIFAFFPASQSAGQHETRSCALDDAQNGPGHMAQQCPVCCINCVDPPSRWQRASWYRFPCPQTISTCARSAWKGEILHAQQRKTLAIGGFCDLYDPLCAYIQAGMDYDGAAEADCTENGVDTAVNNKSGCDRQGVLHVLWEGLAETQNGVRTRKMWSRTWDRVGQAYPVHRRPPPPLHSREMMSGKYTISYAMSYTISYTTSHTISYTTSYTILHTISYTMLCVGQKSDACGGDVVGRWYRQKRKYYIIVTQHLDSCLDNSIVWCYWDSNREPIDSKWQLDRHAKEPSHLPCSQCVNDGICLVLYLSGICCQWNRWKHAKCHVQAYEM